MQINLNVPLTQIDGTAIENANVADLAINALLADHPDEKIDGDEKARRYQLASRIQVAKGGEKHSTNATELKVEEAALLKKLIGAAYQPLFVGQAYAVLEG